MAFRASACLLVTLLCSEAANADWDQKLDGKLDLEIQKLVLRELKFRALVGSQTVIKQRLTSRLYWTNGGQNEQTQVPQHHVVTYRRTVGGKLQPCGKPKDYFYAHVLEFKKAQWQDKIRLIHLEGPTAKAPNKTNAEEYVKDVLAWRQAEATQEFLAKLIPEVTIRLQVRLQNMAKTLSKIDKSALEAVQNIRIREIKLKALYQAIDVKILNKSGHPETLTLLELSNESCEPPLPEALFLGVIYLEGGLDPKFTSFFYSRVTLLGYGVKKYSTQFQPFGDEISSLCWFNFDELERYKALSGLSQTWEEPMKRFTDKLQLPAESGHCTKVGVNFNFKDIAPYFVLTTDFDTRQINVVLTALNEPCEVTAKMYQSQYTSMDAAEN